ncbi:MAG: hypothetical protein H0W16_10310 [Actinobacteria bacterium]|nr:hypothetical protein [Actinomycetota bacterium]
MELASNPERARAMGEAGRERALGRFLEERCTDRTELLYFESLRKMSIRRSGCSSREDP